MIPKDRGRSKLTAYRLPWTHLPLLLLPFGCEGGPPRRAEAGAPKAPGTEASRAPGLPAASAEAASPPAPAPAGALGLAEALRMALDRNPDLAASRRDEEVSQAALGAARAFPFNPTLAVDVRPYAREKDGSRDETLVAVSLLQEIELAGQWRRRIEAGEADLDVTRFRILDAELRTVASAGRLYFAAIRGRQVAEADASLARLKEDLLRVVERRFAAGLVVATDVALARLEARAARQSAELSRVREESALVDLRKELALEGSGPLVLDGSLEDWSWPPAPAPAPGAVEGSPGVLAAEAEVRAAVARADLASASRIPNVTVGPNFEKDETGTVFLGVEAQVPLPILDGGSARVREKWAERDRSIEAARLRRVKARLDEDAARRRYEDARKLVVASGSGGGEAPEAELRRVRDQFEAGQADIVKVYLAQAALLEARRSALEARYELALAAVELTAAAALSPEALLFPHPPASAGTEKKE